MIPSALQNLYETQQILQLTDQDLYQVLGLTRRSWDAVETGQILLAKPLSRRLQQLVKKQQQPGTENPFSDLIRYKDCHAAIKHNLEQRLTEIEFRLQLSAYGLKKQNMRYTRLDHLEQLYKSMDAVSLSPKQAHFFYRVLYDGWRKDELANHMELRLRHAMLLYEQQYLKNEISNLK